MELELALRKPVARYVEIKYTYLQIARLPAHIPQFPSVVLIRLFSFMQKTNFTVFFSFLL